MAAAFSDMELQDFLNGTKEVNPPPGVVTSEQPCDEDEGNKTLTIVAMHAHRHHAMWVPIIFSIVYFILVAMLWANGDWFTKLNLGLSPVIVSLIWLVVFVGIVWTWVKCLKCCNENGKPSGWISFWFIANMLLLLLCAWAFFVAKNIALTNVCFAFLWLSTIALIVMAAKHWPPGLVFMILYIAVITWAWIVVARLSYRTVNERAGKLFGIMVSSRPNRMDRLKELLKFDESEPQKLPSQQQSPQRPAQQQQQQHVPTVAGGGGTNLTDDLTNPSASTPSPRGTWARDRGFEEF